MGFFFWQLEELTDLLDRCSGCGTVPNGECFFAWKFNTPRSNVPRKAERTTIPSVTAIFEYVVIYFLWHTERCNLCAKIHIYYKKWDKNPHFFKKNGTKIHV